MKLAIFLDSFDFNLITFKITDRADVFKDKKSSTWPNNSDPIEQDRPPVGLACKQKSIQKCERLAFSLKS